MKKPVVIGLAALAVVALVGAGTYRVLQSQRKAAALAAQPEAAASAAAARVLELPAEDLLPVRRMELQRRIEFSGSVRATQSTFVKARVAADVRMLNVREGDRVRMGQVLVQQDTTEFDWRVRQADQQAQAARAQLEIAQRTLANNKALVAQGFISSTALESSASNEAAAQATLQAALAGLELARKSRADTTLTAPMNGLVSQRLVQPGERIGVDTRILEIVDLSRLEIEAALAPEDVAGVRVGQPAHLTVDGASGEIGARVARINPSAQAGSRTVPVYLQVDSHPALRHGLFARGGIEAERRAVLAVPAAALRSDRADPYVYVAQPDRIVSQTVRTGMRGTADGREWVEVTQGLSEGARVVAGSVGPLPEGVRWKPAAAGSGPTRGTAAGGTPGQSPAASAPASAAAR